MDEKKAQSDGKGKGKEIDRNADGDTGKTVLSGIVSSTTALLESVVKNPTSSINKDLSSLQGSSSSKQSQHVGPHSSASTTWAEQGSSSAARTADAAGFRSMDLSGANLVSGALPAEQEFESFLNGSTEETFAQYEAPSGTGASTGDFQAGSRTVVGPSQPIDGANVLDILSDREAMSSIWDEVPPQEPVPLRELPNLEHPAVVEFLACEDIVEFLSLPTLADWGYSEEIWGDYVGLIREAKEEVQQENVLVEKSKAERESAVERLRQVWGHLRSSKL